MEPRFMARRSDVAVLPPGQDDRFAGYGVVALPFSSGYLLALRHFPASTLGAGYDSLWMREPDGQWTILTTVPGDLACPRYFSSALRAAEQTEIRLHWHSPSVLVVSVAAPWDLSWELDLGTSAVSALMSAVCPVIPAGWWRGSLFSRVMGVMAGSLFAAGRMSLSGKTPNGNQYTMGPRRVWVIRDSRASLRGQDLGTPARLAVQDRLGDFWLPQRGLFMQGWAGFD
ncbi:MULTISPECIES: hypothetical protein [Arthrobacter]|uniref:Uncharacterized protein n=2 Tax=Arthrobacter TaxID=1663 RepID=A0ABU9KN28_9MICC|nr:hypothetical protein [Arthrobacter sp. YJM1]MDP5228256.1 hypothetical protein [Arthrobacter sp. YJM1]